MIYNVENKIKNFAEATGLCGRVEMTHGTLYVTLLQNDRFDYFHEILKNFYVDNINPDGAVNMYALPGDEFCFDFVPKDAEKDPVDVESVLDMEIEAEMGR
jgi:hypothetical protein